VRFAKRLSGAPAARVVGRASLQCAYVRVAAYGDSEAVWRTNF
jgi:hypothetical protein